MAQTQNEVTWLPPWRFPDRAALHLQRAADYARDPAGYLKDKLGEQTFNARKHLLCIPDAVNEDIGGRGSHRKHFETHIATLLGKKLGSFFITGVLAQNAALRVWCDRKGKRLAAWHGTAHLELMENRAWAELWGLNRLLIGPDPCLMPGIEDVQAITELPETERPAVILIEIPNRSLAMTPYSWDELVAISTLCKEAGIPLHMDGARLWDIEPYYQETFGKSMKDIATLFDSVYVSLYKGLSGTTGCMLMSPDEEFQNEVHMWRSRAGGNGFSALYNIVDNERAFNENIGTFVERKRQATEMIRQVKEATKQYTINGEPIISFAPEPITAAQFYVHYRGFTEAQGVIAKDRVQERTGIRIFGGLMSWDWQQKLLQGKVELKMGVKMFDDDSERHWISELIIDGYNTHLPISMFVTGFTEFCKEILDQQHDGGTS